MSTAKKMLPAPPSSFHEYCKRVANYLRAREANVLRGQPERLQALDQTTDHDILKRWSWMSAIVGGISVLGLMIAGMVLHGLLPLILMQLLSAVTKVCMALVCAMFALAAYFTFFMPADNQDGG